MQALEEAELPKEVPLHVQVLKAERKLQALQKVLGRLETTLDKLEEQKFALDQQIHDIKLKGQDICAQIAATEHDKAIAVSTMAQLSCQAPGPQGILQGLGLDLQKAAGAEQCRPLLQQIEMLVARIRDACGAAEGQDGLPPTQLQGTETPVQSPDPAAAAEDDTQPGVPSFGTLRGARFRVTPYAGPVAAKEESQTYSGKDLGLEGASATEFDAMDAVARQSQHEGAQGGQLVEGGLQKQGQ